MIAFFHLERLASQGVGYRLLMLLVAFNYFSFRVELFDEEYNANHPVHCTTCSFTQSSTNWETFDKDNAPKAFVLRFDMQVECFGLIRRQSIPFHPLRPTYQPVRDKSPPINPF